MKLFRTLILLLLCVMLPLSGLAATGLTGECPMQTTVAAADGTNLSAVMPGCDMMKSSTAGKTKGGFCKSAAQCQFGSLYYPAPTAAISRPMAVSHPLVFHYAKLLSIRETSGLWRPPRAI